MIVRWVVERVHVTATRERLRRVADVGVGKGEGGGGVLERAVRWSVEGRGAGCEGGKVSCAGLFDRCFVVTQVLSLYAKQFGTRWDLELNFFLILSELNFFLILSIS